MKALITASLSEESLNELKKLMKITYEPWRETGIIYFDVKELIEKLKDYDIFITEADDLKKEELFEQINLKLLVSCRGDPFNVNLNAATKKHIPVLYTPLRNVDAVAELTIGLMLMLARKLHIVDRIIHSKEFEIIEFEDYVDYLNKFQGIELKGKTIGIIGLGQIGRRVANRLKSFDVKFLIYDPYVNKDLAKEYGDVVDIDYLMRNSDFITIHAIATDENDNLINEERIDMMKKTAFLINTSKGSIIDYDGLKKALEEKKIGGAALDVFPLEPIDEDNEFIELHNAIITPHIGGDTEEIIKRQSEILLRDIKTWLNGKNPQYIMNPEVVRDGEIKRSLSDENIINLKKEIVDLCKQLLKEGHVIGSAGNVSVRMWKDEKEFVLITPSNVQYYEMAPEDILTIDMEGKVIEGKRNPSVEKKMHLSIYKEREDVNAIIHAHSIYSTVLSALDMVIPPIFEEFVPYIGGEVLCANYGEAGSEELADGVLSALEERNAVLLANHGNLCCGSHLDGAYTVLKYLERGAKIYYLAKLVKEPNLLPEDTIDYEMDIFDIFKDSKKI
ncbi:MAG: class II aldolase/adducin family protein [Candidatus Lokiarchaeota archaeon]|nr:class II aldolase/adducin family protein [Candidatus Lokiarchaeota archaeon]